LGDKENALHWLEKSQEKHVTDLIGIAQDAHFVQMRGDPRFQTLLQRIGTPQ
jgi:hypothetical protein